MNDRIYLVDKEESEKIDLVKSMMCIAVLFLHSYSSKWAESKDAIAIAFSWFTNYFSNIICDCAVPVYIVLSAIFLYSRNFDWKQNIKKKVWTLLVPYFLIDALWIVANILKAVASSKESLFVTYGIIDWIDAFLGVRGDFKPALTVLWYIRDLFILNMFAIPIKKLVDRFPKIILFFTLVIWLSGIKTGFVHSYALVFFILGYYLVKYNIHVSRTKMFNFMPLTFICIGLSIMTAVVPQVIAIHRIFILLQMALVAALAYRLDFSEKAVNIIAPATFFIYLTHRFVYMAIDFFFDDTLTSYMITYFLKPFLAFGLCLFAYYFMRKYLPRTLAILTGGRSSKK